MTNSSQSHVKYSCPKCGAETKRIEIELERNDFGKVLLLGWLALFFPSKDRALVCEHCGKVFARHSQDSELSQKVTRFMIMLLCLSVLTGVVLWLVYLQSRG